MSRRRAEEPPNRRRADRTPFVASLIILWTGWTGFPASGVAAFIVRTGWRRKHARQVQGRPE